MTGLLKKPIVMTLLLLQVLCVPRTVLAENGEVHVPLAAGSGMNSVAHLQQHNRLIEGKIADIRQPQPIELDAISEKKQEKKRNPFALTDHLRRAAANGDFYPGQKNDEVPPMHLRGLIQGTDGNLVALLEIEKAIHIVRAGDTVGLNDLGRNTVIRIKKINRLNIIVETGTVGQLIIVR